MPKIEMTNMVMIQDKKTGKVLVQDRVKNWKGLSFPGGHVEDNESIIDSAVREVKEETGLDICNLKYCGIVHWLNKNTLERFMVFLYKTTDYSGEFIAESDEGRNFWITVGEMRDATSENQMPKNYLPMFLENKYCEAFGQWKDDEPWEIVCK